MSEHVVAGKTITMPVEVRRATAAMALFSVDLAAAQRVVGYSGLRLQKYRPGRGLCALIFVRYEDGDLGPYNEFGVAFPTTGNGVFIHRLPVDGEFTMAAGRQIWGFPKELAEFDVRYGSTFSGTLGHRGETVLSLQIGRGLPTPGAVFSRPLDAYSCLAGVTRRTSWTMTPGSVRARPGGARVTLGDHPWAEELRSIGLARRALSITHMPTLRMQFGDAAPVDDGPGSQPHVG